MTQATLEQKVGVPTAATVHQSANAMDALSSFIQRHTGNDEVTMSLVIDSAETSMSLPSEALRLLLEILTEMAKGNSVSVAAVQTELTTQQAADMLNVSRPYLVRLIELRKIPSRRVGNRRRVLLADVLAYKGVDDAHRQEIADELAAEAQRLGLDY